MGSDGMGGVGYLCFCPSQSQTRCSRGSRALLPWRRISRTVGRWLQRKVPFVVTSIFLPSSRVLLNRKCVLMWMGAF
ncbi:hypothetical protein TNCV_691131 [Trichonephila clavipes]|nr:hypothetical protein TNCV_691131 [Trichonephila clavipes]